MNSQAAIDNDTYEISETLQKSDIDFIHSIKVNPRATLITEIKFSSPSLGKIRTLSDPVSIANAMIAGGAKALSVLTQPNLFNGSPDYFIKVRKAVKVPMLMKDIIIDKVQIDAAEKMGADYMLLIQSLFDQNYLKDIEEFIAYGHKKGLNVLVEANSKSEFENSLKTEADLLGINNRNLDTLELDLDTTKNILDGIEKTRPILSESGIESPEDIKFLKKHGADAFLVGSSLMKSENIEEDVKKLVNAI